MPHETYMLRVVQYDFEVDGEDMFPSLSLRTIKYLARPFVVSAGSRDEAIDIVTERTGWLIKEVEFMEYNKID